MKRSPPPLPPTPPDLFLEPLGLGDPILGTSARGAERFQCSSSCKAGSKFQYEPGVSYLFQYRASTASSVSGTSVEEESRHLVSATAVISVLSACELSLEVRNPRGPVWVLEDSSWSDS
ncbi:unnamed protein product [Timema podura]|uniref:REJ domain-containing protein n=1 Tax=Timema podura TaxID=61482 RepID=A0ABN7PH88_TIMPD|nr:unnamed protein product [Timema podura]